MEEDLGIMSMGNSKLLKIYCPWYVLRQVRQVYFPEWRIAEGPFGLSSCWPVTSSRVQTVEEDLCIMSQGNSKLLKSLLSLVCPEGSQTSLLPYKIQGLGLVLKYCGSEALFWLCGLLTYIDNMGSPIVSKLIIIQESSFAVAKDLDMSMCSGPVVREPSVWDPNVQDP